MAYVVQQPVAVQGMMVGGGNRNAKNLPVSGNGREWSHGLCGCMGDCGTCIMAWCFPCVVFGQVKKRYEHLNSKGFPDPNHGGCCSCDCMLHACLLGCGFGWVMQMGVRGNIRGRYNIKGGCCGDCCSALFCTPCELVQESRELELEERSFSGGKR